MNPDVGAPAWQWLKDVAVEELAWVIHNYGENDDPLLSERIAAALVASRDTWGNKLTCRQAGAIISRTVKCGSYIKPMNRAKLTFQAFRVHLNQEMQQLESVLNGAFRSLEPNGHCIVISYNREVDVAILEFMRRREEPPKDLWGLPPDRVCELWPLVTTDVAYTVVQAGKPIKPTATDVENNTHRRPHSLHILQKGLRAFSFDRLPSQLEPRRVCDRMFSPGTTPVGSVKGVIDVCGSWWGSGVDK